eukprot:2471274-Prymnesium_polylepis.1
MVCVWCVCGAWCATRAAACRVPRAACRARTSPPHTATICPTSGKLSENEPRRVLSRSAGAVRVRNINGRPPLPSPSPPSPPSPSSPSSACPPPPPRPSVALRRSNRSARDSRCESAKS